MKRGLPASRGKAGLPIHAGHCARRSSSEVVITTWTARRIMRIPASLVGLLPHGFMARDMVPRVAARAAACAKREAQIGSVATRRSFKVTRVRAHLAAGD